MAYYYDPYLTGLPVRRGSLIRKRLSATGNMVWTVTTAPAINPVTVSDVKLHARISTDAEDVYLESLVTAVTSAVEKYLGRALIRQTIRARMDFWPRIVVTLPMPPLIDIVQVATASEDDVLTVYAATNYYAIIEGTPGEIVLKRSVTPPINTARDYGGFVIDFRAGYGTVSRDVPAGIVEAIKLWVSEVYESRDFDSKNPPKSVTDRLDLYRTSGVIAR